VNLRRGVEETLLALVALLAIVCAVVRACMQSITLDEADTYFWFASRSARYIWFPFPNNHVLNTLLIWITTRIFGTSAFSVRIPALLGAVLYVLTCYFLCRSITDRRSLQLPVLICLLYNPFVLDFMVAARGYSLADAFLLAAIAVPVWQRVKGRPSLRTACLIASLALGLSFGANFSFAFVDLAAFLAILTWAIRRRGADSMVRVAGFCVLPGLFVALLLGGYPLAHWPKGELWYGAHSLAEMTHSLIDASFYRLNTRFLDADLNDIMDLIRAMVVPLLAILCACQVVATMLDRRKPPEMRLQPRLAALQGALAGIIALSVLLSWVAFRFDKLPLPMTRTGIYLIPLSTLLAGVIAAAPVRSRVSRWLRQAMTGAFICLACYFLLCLRFTYFKEYEYDADVKDVYSVLARLNHAYGVRDIVAGGFYVNSLNFYRVVSGKETFPAFGYLPEHQYPSGKSIYVLEGSFEREFIEKEGLAVVYRGKRTAVVVAVTPGGKIPTVEP
jgi:4-amino-4-deoxy-L-arabinose transferase-like glycosyltransferase